MVPNIMIGITKTLFKGAADSEAAAAKEMLVVNVLNDGVTQSRPDNWWTKA